MRYVAALVCALTAAALSHSALAQAKQDFTLVNATGYSISHVYVSPAKEDSWGEDVLGRDTLDDDETVPIHFARKEKSCKWDLRVTYEDDDSNVVWRAIDLCEISKITIKYNRKTDETSALTE